MKLWNPKLKFGWRTVLWGTVAGGVFVMGLSCSGRSQARLLEIGLGINNPTEFQNIVTKDNSGFRERNYRIYLEGESNRIWSLLFRKGYKETFPTRESAEYWRRQFASAGRIPELPATSGTVRFFERSGWSGFGDSDFIAVGPGGTQLWFRSFSY